MSTTIAGITLSLEQAYQQDIDVGNETEVVARLRKLPRAEFVTGMDDLIAYLNTVPRELVADRYAALLIEAAGGEPDDAS